MSFKRVLTIVTCLLILLIFSFSLHSGVSSHRQSEEVAETVTRVLARCHIHIDSHAYQIYRPFLNPGETADRDLFFRKSAHLAEYFLLGVFSSVLLYVGSFSGTWRPNQLAFFFCGPLTALVDEKILQQYLVAQRTSTYQDVLLDSIGFYAAVLLCSTVYALITLVARGRTSPPSGGNGRSHPG